MRIVRVAGAAGVAAVALGASLLVGVPTASAAGPLFTNSTITDSQNPWTTGSPITYLVTVGDSFPGDCSNPRIPPPATDAPQGTVTVVDTTTGITLGSAPLGGGAAQCQLGNTGTVENTAAGQVTYTFPASRAGSTDHIVATYTPADSTRWQSSTATTEQQFLGTPPPPPPPPVAQSLLSALFTFLDALLHALGL